MFNYVNIEHMCYRRKSLIPTGDGMSRLSIEIPESQHQQIKAMAALRGVSIKDYILEKTLTPAQAATGKFEESALVQLEAFLAPRIAAAGRGEFEHSTIKEIMAEARLQRKKK
jgi:hypothetical protein